MIARILFYSWIAAMVAGATIFNVGFIQKAYAPSPAWCTKYLEDGTFINACFSGERAKKECQNTAIELQGSKCLQIKKFEF